jgi:hypothetical protein
VVADDNPEFLDVMISILRMEFDVVATAADGRSALNCVWLWVRFCLAFSHKPENMNCPRQPLCNMTRRIFRPY